MKNPSNEFDEYLRQGEPQKRERAEAWGVVIGLHKQFADKHPTSLTVKGLAFIKSAE